MARRNSFVVTARCRDCGTPVDAFGDYCAACHIGDCIYCKTPIAYGLTLDDGRVVCTMCLGAN